jgi:hypothetical protein
MVIISTKAVATIIHAVSAALMVEDSANAGVAADVAIKNIAAALTAARRGSAPMMFPPAFASFYSTKQTACPGRGAAFFTLLRRAGTVPNRSVMAGLKREARLRALARP